MNDKTKNGSASSKIHQLLERKLYILAQEQALQLLEKTPNDVEAIVLLSQVYFEGQDYLSAASTMEKAIGILPNEPDFYRLAGMSYAQGGMHELGLEMARKYLHLTNHSVLGWQLICNIYEKTGKTEEAREALSHVPATDQFYEANQILNTKLLYAEKEYGKAIDTIRKYHEWAEKNIDIAKLDSSSQSNEMFVDSWFLKTKIFNKTGEYDKAWEAASYIHEIANQEWNQEKFDKKQEHIKNIFNAENVKACAHATDPFEQPVFIAGNARSGTSLLEQILSMHPQIGNGGELMVTGGLQRRLQSITDSFHPYPECIFDMRVDDANRCSQEYRKAIEWFSIGKTRVTNKAIGLQSQIGFLSLMLPQSRTIMLHRHPLDNCISCFTTNLVHSGHGYTKSLETLGKTWITRRKLQDYWKDVVDTPIMDLHYEELVTNQESETRRLIDFLDLPWEEDCLHFHKSRRVAATISYDQVNQKMYTSSSGRWKNYEKHLGPLIDIVSDYI